MQCCSQNDNACSSANYCCSGVHVMAGLLVVDLAPDRDRHDLDLTAGWDLAPE